MKLPCAADWKFRKIARKAQFHESTEKRYRRLAVLQVKSIFVGVIIHTEDPHWIVDIKCGNAEK